MLSSCKEGFFAKLSLAWEHFLQGQDSSLFYSHYLQWLNLKDFFKVVLILHKHYLGGE